jgi:endonuclease/exonuclease/phosphatase family metal-dependent hydrolase
VALVSPHIAVVAEEEERSAVVDHVYLEVATVQQFQHGAGTEAEEVLARGTDAEPDGDDVSTHAAAEVLVLVVVEARDRHGHGVVDTMLRLQSLTVPNKAATDVGQHHRAALRFHVELEEDRTVPLVVVHAAWCTTERFLRFY